MGSQIKKCHLTELQPCHEGKEFVNLTAGDAGEDRDWLFYYFEKWLCDDILGQTPRKSDWRCWKWKVQKSEIETSEISNVHCTSMYEGNDLWMEWTGMDQNGPEWTTHYESCRSQQHFEYRHGYVRGNAWNVMKDLRIWTSDGMDD